MSPFVLFGLRQSGVRFRSSQRRLSGRAGHRPRQGVGRQLARRLYGGGRGARRRILLTAAWGPERARGCPRNTLMRVRHVACAVLPLKRPDGRADGGVDEIAAGSLG